MSEEKKSTKAFQSEPKFELRNYLLQKFFCLKFQKKCVFHHDC